MYEVICARMDALAAVFGLLRKEARVRRGGGVNPWDHAGGERGREMEKGRGSEETLVERREKV